MAEKSDDGGQKWRMVLMVDFALGFGMNHELYFLLEERVRI